MINKNQVSTIDAKSIDNERTDQITQLKDVDKIFMHLLKEPCKWKQQNN